MPAFALSSTALLNLLRFGYQAIEHDQGQTEILTEGCGDATVLVMGDSESVPGKICA